jgi:putative endopeptidase
MGVFYMKFKMALLAAASASLIALAVSAPAYAKDTAPVAKKDGPQLGSFGFDDSGMDKSVEPGDDFYGYANGSWEKRTELPADKSNYGMFTALDDLSKDRVKAILEGQLKQPKSKLGVAYASYLDEAAIEAKGLAPVNPMLAEIRAVKTKLQFEALLPKMAPKGVGALFYGYVGQDDKNPESYIFSMGQGGTGLPDRDMYLLDNPKFEAIRTAYKGFLTQMLNHAGEKNAEARAKAIFDTEKKIATIHWTREDSSDATKTYNKFTTADLDKLTPGMSISTMLKTISPKITEVLVAQPSALTGIAKIYADTDISVFKDQLLIGTLTTFADVLPKAVDATVFDFYSKTLSGTPQQQARWKRSVSFVEGAIPDEIGKLYAAQYFPAETKAAVNMLVKNILASMGRRIDNLSWMQPQTKVRARQKLANFTTKIGYPDKWHNYTKLSMVKGDAFGNNVRANQFGFADNISKLGTPIRRWEWGMLPQTINAYANFGMNEIVFPAAILQPPFFDPKADPAINYGGIGAVIGHEISHHFDDQGSKYDEKGRLSDWWTESDVKAFEAAGKSLIAQYDKYEVFPGEFVKGEFTLGENIGDLAGLTIAYDAYKTALNGKAAPVIDGYTGDQRFFLGWAQVWRRKYREANLRQRLLTDPHSPSKQRAWVMRNLDKWYEAFQPKADDKMVLKPEERVRIW